MARTICGNWRSILREGTSIRKSLNTLFANLDGDTARAALVEGIAASDGGRESIARNREQHLADIGLVGAIKEYTYMDQAPVQNVSIEKSLETTLTILNHKLKQGDGGAARLSARFSFSREFVCSELKPGRDQHY